MAVDYALIGARIKKRRKAAGLTQEQLSERLYVSPGYVSQIERGIAKANLDMLSGICAQIGCDLTYLFGGATLERGTYLDDELTERWGRMSPEQKQKALKIIDILNENK